MMITSAPLPSTRRRQWGSEKRREPLATVHARPSAAKIVWARIAIGVTIAAWIGYMLLTVLPQLVDGGGVFRSLEAMLYALVVTFLTFSALMYLVAREGALRRFRDHVRAPRGELDRHFAEGHTGGLTVLVPSYAEEPAVVRKTMWSAALQEYPGLRVVLLLDDNPFPTDPLTQARLDETRAIASDIEDALGVPGARFERALLQYESAWLVGGVMPQDAAAEVREEYREAVRWLRELAEEWPHEDHVDTFFIDQVLRGLADDLAATADALDAAEEAGDAPDPDRILQLHRRLVRIFSVEATTFERKRYASLSNEPNKAMNLNAYLGLLGGRYVEHPTDNGTVLVPATGGHEPDLVIPDTPFVLTLDADSLLLRDYCLRLVHFLEQPENAKVAVTQTPYSSFRGAPTRIERLAGATTDIQHILHQGMSAHEATFWVGANAVIRRAALEDIVQVEYVDGYEVRRYVQDRTVIEDTESSIDLADQGWTLVNYPERLSYSATPPDFGSLVVQRRRWANGGLLIMPKFLSYAQRRRKSHKPITWSEWMLRTNYMASLAWASFGLIMLLTYPFDSRLLSPLVVFAALPYFISQASDLRYCGYRSIDILRIYGFNLILLPVNLAGVLKSIEQALTGKKIPFARTPKVRNRTATQLLYVVAPYAIVVFSVFTAWWNVMHENWGTAAFAAFNATLAAWSIVENIGILESIADTWLGLTDWMWVDATPKKLRVATSVADEPERPDWRASLYHGHPASGETSPEYLPPPVLPERPLVLEVAATDAEPRRELAPGAPQPRALEALAVVVDPVVADVAPSEPDLVPVVEIRRDVVIEAEPARVSEPEPAPEPELEPEPEPALEPELAVEPTVEADPAVAAEPAAPERELPPEPISVVAHEFETTYEVFQPTYAIGPAYAAHLVPDLWIPAPAARYAEESPVAAAPPVVPEPAAQPAAHVEHWAPPATQIFPQPPVPVNVPVQPAPYQQPIMYPSPQPPVLPQPAAWYPAPQPQAYSAPQPPAYPAQQAQPYSATQQVYPPVPEGTWHSPDPWAGAAAPQTSAAGWAAPAWPEPGAAVPVRPVPVIRGEVPLSPRAPVSRPTRGRGRG